MNKSKFETARDVAAKSSKGEWEKDTLRSMRERFDRESFDFGYDCGAAYERARTGKLLKALDEIGMYGETDASKQAKIAIRAISAFESEE